MGKGYTIADIDYASGVLVAAVQSKDPFLSNGVFVKDSIIPTWQAPDHVAAAAGKTAYFGGGLLSGKPFFARGVSAMTAHPAGFLLGTAFGQVFLGRALFCTTGGHVTALRASADGNRVAVGHARSHGVLVYDGHGRLVERIPFAGRVDDLAFRPDWTLMIGGA